MVKYVSGELHANGETVTITNPEDVKALRANFNARYFKTSDGSTEYGVISEASAFVKLTIDTKTDLLADKPTCDNYEIHPSDSDATEPDEDEPEEV